MRRVLNELEYMMFVLGQPYNMVNWKRLRGIVNVEKLRAAIDKVQKRHPMLQVTVIRGSDGVPWFSSERVGRIPFVVLPMQDANHARRVVQQRLEMRFSMYDPLSVSTWNGDPVARTPLMQITLLQGQGFSDLITCVQHVITDGISMNGFSRDLLTFYMNPAKKVETLDTVLRHGHEFIASKPGLMARNKPIFLVLQKGLKFFHMIRFRGKTSALGDHLFETPHAYWSLEWSLTAEQTEHFLNRCKVEGVLVNAAICTAYLHEYNVINSPIDARPFVRVSVGDSFGLLTSGALVLHEYNGAIDFWANARRYSKKLNRAMQGSKIFQFANVVSKYMPLPLMLSIMGFMMELTAATRRTQPPFVITNLGSIDKVGIPVDTGDFTLEQFHCAASNPMGAIIVVVLTFGKSMRFFTQFMEPPENRAHIELVGKRTKALLLHEVNRTSIEADDRPHREDQI